MPKPDISVVIPTFRRPAELAEALASIRRQAGVAVEVIVIDDCPDGSAEAAAAPFADLPLVYLRNRPHSGGRPAQVRNLGAARATGHLIHFLDDDDRVPEGHYAATTALFRASPGTDLVFGRIAPFGADPAAVAEEAAYFAQAAARARRCARLGGRWGFSAALVFRPTLLVCGAAVMRRACVPALGGFDTGLGLMEDVEFFARAVRRYGARFVDRPTLHYRIGPSLMHRASQSGLIATSYRQMQARYRAERGALDFYLLKSVAKITRA